LVVLLLLFGGCASIDQSIIKASPAPNAGFLPEPELLVERRERYPFHGVWAKTSFESFDYHTKIFIAPVDTSHLLDVSPWNSASLRGEDLDGDAVEFAKESWSILREAFSENESITIVDQPGPETLLLELSIVELIPAKTWLSAIGIGAFVMPLLAGIPIGTAAALAENGSIAIEGIVRDGSSKEILLMFADRESSKTRILDLQTLTWYGHAREIMEDWAYQIKELLTTPHNHTVFDSEGFSWAPF